MNYCVVTTVNKPTKAIEELYKKFGNNLLIVGDKKTPDDWNYYGIKPMNESGKLYAPDNHYARKNLGYLTAIKSGAKLIYDTDDDNIPNEKFYFRQLTIYANESFGEGWYNVYRNFTNEFIWPRGYSLKNVKETPVFGQAVTRESSIQQGLADDDPDVDAIWRLLYSKKVTFDKNMGVYVLPNTWCPFNSQSTWWFPKAYPLMYLPVTASFRMTDIWRSFVAQRCLWELGEGVTFHSPSEVFQDRNEHDLLKNFEDEVSGYLNNDLIVKNLSNIKLEQGVENICNNLLNCYQLLVDMGVLKPHEIKSVYEWIKDINEVWKP